MKIKKRKKKFRYFVAFRPIAEEVTQEEKK